MNTVLALAGPVACTAGLVAAHLTWLRPWDAARRLRTTVTVLERDIEADEQLLHLPPESRHVHLLATVLGLVAQNPLRWRADLTLQLPFADGRQIELSAVERARLERYSRRLELALSEYQAAVRPIGARVARDVARILFDPSSYWREIDLADQPPPVEARVVVLDVDRPVTDPRL